MFRATRLGGVCMCVWMTNSPSFVGEDACHSGKCTCCDGTQEEVEAQRVSLQKKKKSKEDEILEFTNQLSKLQVGASRRKTEAAPCLSIHCGGDRYAA